MHDPKAFIALPGYGIEAEVDVMKILIGNISLLTNRHISICSIKNSIDSLCKQGKTTVIMTIDNCPAAIFAFSDKIRSNAKTAVEQLLALGIDIHMLTGDNMEAAKYAAQITGIKNICSGILPNNKAAEIKRLQAENKTAAMVGDGINDAPALAAADVGIAIGSGTDAALETSDIILLKNDLTLLTTVITLSRKTIHKITQNLFWAFFYNSAAIPFAATGHLSPQIGSLCMAFSSISVLLNSLSLKRSI